MVVTISIFQLAKLHLKAGEVVIFGTSSKVQISGLKIWKEKNQIDLLIKNPCKPPKIGDDVYII